MKTFDLGIALFSLIIILLGLYYKRLKRSPFNETFLAMLFGIGLSPFLLNILIVEEWGKQEDILEKACRLTLAMALMATAFKLSKGYFSVHRKVQASLLLIVMPAMFLTSGLIIHLVTGMDWLISLLIGAIVTPTDPVLAGTIVTGETATEFLPRNTRETILFESGANDGLAFPFVMLCLLLIEKQEHAWKEWVGKTLLWETGGAILIGLIIGYIAGRILEFCIKKKFTGQPAILAFSMSIGFFVLTALELIHVNSILAVFMAGLMLNETLGKQEDIEEEEIQEMMSRLFTIPIFVLFGLIIPWDSWFELGWKAIVIMLAVIMFRRIPYLLVISPLMKGFKFKDLLFIGWFGPIGVAALYYCFYSYKKLHQEEIWTITSLVVFSSVVAHGMTAYPFLKLYSRNNDKS
ncbi:MAG: cation:proton antiporter [Cytophagaceae bacterium]